MCSPDVNSEMIPIACVMFMSQMWRCDASLLSSCSYGQTWQLQISTSSNVWSHQDLFVAHLTMSSLIALHLYFLCLLGHVDTEGGISKWLSISCMTYSLSQWELTPCQISQHSLLTIRAPVSVLTRCLYILLTNLLKNVITSYSSCLRQSLKVCWSGGFPCRCWWIYAPCPAWS